MKFDFEFLNFVVYCRRRILLKYKKKGVVWINDVKKNCEKLFLMFFVLWNSYFWYYTLMIIIINFQII